MSYISWRKENEDKYRELANDGALHTFPAWKDNQYDETTDKIIAPIIDNLVNNPNMTPVHFACVFAEYLHEQYGVVPADLEIFVQYTIMSYLDQTAKIADKTAKFTAELFKQSNQSSEEGDDNT